MPAKHPRRPRDPNQLAKLIVDLATGAVENGPVNTDDSGKDPAAVSLGRRGGLKGGKRGWLGARTRRRVRGKFGVF